MSGPALVGPKKWHAVAGGYALAVALVAAATWVTIRIKPHLGESISPLYFAAVMISAWHGGWGPGLLATALAGWGSAYFFLENPPHSLPFAIDDVIRLGVFLMVAVLISSLTSLRKRAEALLQQSHDELEVRVRQRTAELKASEERFRLLVEGVSDYAVVMLDAGGCVASWNSGAQRILGYEQGEILGRHVSTFFDGDASKAARQLELAAAQERHEDEGWRRRKDGSRFWANVITTAMRDDSASGRLRGFAQVTRDITELRDLERQVLEISETEQRRMGHDLHDGLGQELTGVAFLAQNLERRLGGAGSAGAGEAGRIVSLVNRSIEQVRDLARGFSPVEMGPDGLRAALTALTRKVRDVYGLSCDLECDEDVRFHDEAAALALYRIAQEALNNAIRHGKPKHIRVGLEEVGNEVVLTVEDDGVGLSAGRRSRDGMGIRVMSYRARMIGARLEISGRGGGGTIVACRYPNALPLAPKPEPTKSHTIGQEVPQPRETYGEEERQRNVEQHQQQHEQQPAYAGAGGGGGGGHGDGGRGAAGGQQGQRSAGR
jgi:PAS domain S-box-containing protein